MKTGYRTLPLQNRRQGTTDKTHTPATHTHFRRLLWHMNFTGKFKKTEVQVHAWLNMKPPPLRVIKCSINIWGVLATNTKQEVTQASATPAMIAMVPPLPDYSIQNIFCESVNFFWSRYNWVPQEITCLPSPQYGMYLHS